MHPQTTSRKRPTAILFALCLFAITALLALMSLTFSMPLPFAARTTPLPKNGLIAFEREITPGNYNYDIYVIEPDGSNERPLLNESYHEIIGEWSTDGTQLLYIVNDGSTEKDGLYTINADGSSPTQLSNTLYCYNAAWSTDGQNIAFMQGNSLGLMFTINADGSNPLEIFPSVHRSRDALYFNAYYWSPDGNTFLFTPIMDAGDYDERREIYAMNADGSNIRPFATGPSDQPSWSPDGTQIAFQSKREGNWDIYVMNADGSNQRRLSDSPVYDQNPLWSPDSRFIAFESGRVGKSEIYVMNADGTNERRVTRNDASDNLLTWSPDGTQLLFKSSEMQVDGKTYESYVYAVNIDGSNLRRMFQTEGTVQWQPLP